MRFDCTIEGLESNWVEVDDRWTRREIADMAAVTDPADLVGWLQKKVTACHIETTGEAITDPAAITLAVLDEAVDVRLYDFLGAVLIQGVGHLRTLGPLSGRLSSAKAGATA